MTWPPKLVLTSKPALALWLQSWSIAGLVAGAWVVDLIPMRTVHRTGIVLALVLLGRSVCLAQSNDGYSFFTSASTPLTGYRVAVVSTSPVWVVGSAQNRFGIEECSYWTDSAGSAIPWPATRVRQPGDKLHRYTRLRLGQFSVPVPVPALDLTFGGIHRSGVRVYSNYAFYPKAYSNE
jgi:hypothetical protein